MLQTLLESSWLLTPQQLAIAAAEKLHSVWCACPVAQTEMVSPSEPSASLEEPLGVWSVRVFEVHPCCDRREMPQGL